MCMGMCALAHVCVFEGEEVNGKNANAKLWASGKSQDPSRTMPSIEP